jgi:hypothetical protein
MLNALGDKHTNVFQVGLESMCGEGCFKRKQLYTLGKQIYLK